MRLTREASLPPPSLLCVLWQVNQFPIGVVIGLSVTTGILCVFICCAVYRSNKRRQEPPKHQPTVDEIFEDVMQKRELGSRASSEESSEDSEESSSG
jgi:hypothetical protein